VLAGHVDSMRRRKYLTAIGLAGLGSTIAGCNDTEESDLEVIVENSEGEPLDNAQVELVQKSEDSSNDETVSIELTNSDGRLSIEELVEGETYVLVASQEGYSEQTSEEFEFEGDQLEATLSLSEVEESPEATPVESPDETPEASGIFEVQVDPTDVTVEKGNELGLEVRLTNTGDGPATQEFQVSIGDETSTIEQVQLDAGEEYEYTPTFDTSDWETGDYDITFYTDDDEASVSVTIEEDGEANLAFNNSEFGVFDVGGLYGRDPTVIISVTNNGEGDSGETRMNVDWLDGNGSFLGTSSTSVRMLRSGEVWQAHIFARGEVQAEQIEDFDLYGDFETFFPEPSDSLEVTDTNLSRDETSGVELNVTVEQTEEPIPDEATAIGRFFNQEGELIGDNTNWETDIPTDRPWRFSIDAPFASERGPAQIEDYEVVIIDGSLF